MTLTPETSTATADEIRDEAQKLLARFETLGFSNARALDILGAAACLVLNGAPDQETADAVFAAWQKGFSRWR